MTNTFPALDIRPQQNQAQVDPLGQMGKMIALRSNMLQLQQQQMAMQSQQAMMDAYTQAGGDYDKASQLMLQSGKVLPNQYLQFQQMAIQHKMEVAGLNKAQNENEQTWGYNTRKQLDPIVNEPDPAKQLQMFNDTQQAMKSDPDAAIKYGPQWQAIANMPYPGPDQLKVFDAHLQGQQKMLEDAKTQAQTQLDVQKAATEKAQMPETTWKAYAAQEEQQEWNAYRAANPGASFTDWQNAKVAQKTTAETAAREAAAFPYQAKLASMRQAIDLQFWNQKDVASEIENKYLQPYSQKMAAVQELNSAVDQAQAGNVAAARGVVLKLIGVANPDGTKKYSTKEAQQFMDMGGVPDRLRGTVQNLLTGDQWTPKMAADIKAYGTAQGQVAEQTLDTGINNVNKLHGTNIGRGLQGGAAAPPALPRPAAAPSATPPTPNAVRVKSNRDGKWHWADRSKPPGQQDLGLAPQ